MMSRESDLGWAAGIVDGEGCISLHTVRTSRGELCFVLRLSVANTNLLMLHRLIEIFHCGALLPQKMYSARHRQRWNWEVCSRKAENVLREIEPYLVNKREEAKVGLLSRRLMGKHGRNTANPNIEELSWLKTRLSELKREPV